MNPAGFNFAANCLIDYRHPQFATRITDSKLSFQLCMVLVGHPKPGLILFKSQVTFLTDNKSLLVEKREAERSRGMNTQLDTADQKAGHCHVNRDINNQVSHVPCKHHN